ncbi:hypothetical protein OIV83_001840 [Microbotryomycetes sp. JL201]|nr:hypothetical protein OIV83_001840 [Microbotryomycetes sp. JL201]
MPPKRRSQLKRQQRTNDASISRRKRVPPARKQTSQSTNGVDQSARADNGGASGTGVKNKGVSLYHKRREAQKRVAAGEDNSSDNGPGETLDDTNEDSDGEERGDGDDDDEEEEPDPFDEQAMLAQRKRSNLRQASQSGKPAAVKQAIASQRNRSQRPEEDDDVERAQNVVASSSLAMPTAAQPGKGKVASSMQPPQRNKRAIADENEGQRQPSSKRIRGKAGQLPGRPVTPAKHANNRSQTDDNLIPLTKAVQSETVKNATVESGAVDERADPIRGRLDKNPQPRPSWRPAEYIRSQQGADEQSGVSTGKSHKQVDVKEANRPDNDERPAVFNHMTEEGQWESDRIWFAPKFEPQSERQAMIGDVLGNGGKVVEDMEDAIIVIIPRGPAQSFKHMIESANALQCTPVRQLWIEECLDLSRKSNFAWRCDPNRYMVSVPVKRKARQEFNEREMDALTRAYIKRIEGTFENDGEAARYAFEKSNTTRHSASTFYKYFIRQQDQLSVRARKMVKAQARERQASQDAEQPNQEDDRVDNDDDDDDDSSDEVADLLTSQVKSRGRE